MATLARKRTSIAPRRRGPSPQLVKLKERLKTAAKRARGRSGASDKERTLLTVAGSVALALAAKKGINLPTVANIDPGILYGAAFSLVLPRYVGGKNGSRMQAVGDGMLAAAAARSFERGSVKVAGEDDDDLSVSGVEISGDGDDDDLT